jgi:iron complex outermembrane receptor protein
MGRLKLIRAVLLAGAGQALLWTAASAQDAAPPPATGVSTLATVVVTAQKRSESVLNTPLSITALSGEGLSAAGASDFQDYARSVPGLSAEGSGVGRNQVVVRGVTTGYGQRAATVGQYIDDVPLNFNFTETRPSQVNVDPDLFDVQRVEVLRGPQGTLYGATALAGVLKIVTNDPSLDRYEARIQGSGAGVDHGDADYALRGMVSAPIVTDKVGLRIVGYDDEQGGIIDNVGTGKNDGDEQTSKGARAILLVKPVEGVRLRGAIIYQDIDEHGFSSSDVDPATGQFTYGAYKQSRLTPEHAELKSTIYSLNGGFDLGHYAVLDVSYGYQEAKRGTYSDLSEGSLFGLPPGSPNSDLHTYLSGSGKSSVEARLSSTHTEHFDWMVGAYYTEERLDFGQDELELGQSALHITGVAHYQEEAGFGNATWHITSKWDLEGGVRYSRTDQHFTANALLGAISIPDFGRSTSDEGADWAASLRYKPEQDLTLYGRVATGFNPGSLNLVARAINTLVPALAVPETTQREQLINYEGGAKARFWDGRATLDASAYYIDWSKIQLTMNTVASGLTYTDNAGDATVKGFEFEGAVRPLDELTLSATGAYTDAELTKVIGEPTNGERKGDNLPGVPKYSFALNADEERPLRGEWVGFAGASLTYLGERPAIFPANPDYSDFIKMKPSTTLDLRLGVRTPRYEIMVFAKNLTDALVETAFDPQFSQMYYGRPRTVGVRLDARF